MFIRKSKYEELCNRVLDVEQKLKDLDVQVNDDIKTCKSNLLFDFYGISRKGKYPTLKSKVDAIIDHLGINVTGADAKPESIKVIAPKEKSKEKKK